MKFSNKDVSSKCDQIHRFLRIWSHLLKRSLMEMDNVLVLPKNMSLNLAAVLLEKQSQETVYNSTSFLKIFCKEILIIKEEFEEINSINYSSMPRYI